MGATRVKAGLVEQGVGVVATEVAAVADHRSPEQLVELLAQLLDRLTIGRDGPKGVGLIAPGVLDRSAGIVRQSPNFPSWRDEPLGAALQRRVGLPVILDNDANGATLAEHRLGAGRGSSTMICLTLGTGVGGGVILGGELWRGARGMAGELGHVTVVSGGRACGCGNLGCLEQYVGAVGIRKTLRERGGRWLELTDSPDAPRALSALAAAGDVEALELFADLGRYLGLGIVSILHVLDMECVVLTGGVAQSYALLEPTLLSTVQERAYKAMSSGLRLAPGTLGDEAGVLGAVLLAQEGLEYVA